MFKKEFERRLFHLRDCIDNYEKTGNESSIMPGLFSCFSFVWQNQGNAVRVSFKYK